MWSNGYNLYPNMPQQDMQANNWLNQSMAGGMSNPFGLRFDNYMTGATANPFAGQSFQNAYQPYGNFGYQFRG